MSTIIGLVSTFRLPLHRKRELDVRAEKGTDEVQNREAGNMDWTLEQSETRMKSKTGKPEEQIGC